MARKAVLVITAVLFLSGTIPAFARHDDKKAPAPNESAYEHASDMARFKRTGEAADKDARKAAKKAEKESKKAEKELHKAGKKAKK